MSSAPFSLSESVTRAIGRRALLPTRKQDWPLSSSALQELQRDADEASLEEVRRYASDKAWRWPARPLFFLCDLHADTDAFLLSLMASGGVERTGAADRDFRLTDSGRQGRFVIGGDCFDKGPDNLRLLRCLKHLIDLGANVSILAGNHDLRTYLGLCYAGRRETKLQHLFVRMGKKAMPLFLEIRDAMRREGELEDPLLEDAEVRRRLFPTGDWYGAFQAEAAPLLSVGKLEKELSSIREKANELEAACGRLGMTLGELYAALQRARHMFLHRDGEFAWYFTRMRLAVQEGSFLFIHAGVDDTVTRVLHRGGVPALNAWYRRLFEGDLFELYYGPLGNSFRTKYRPTDLPLSERGVADLHGAGIYAIVHGHRNIRHGQRLTLRAGVLQLECDASVDQNTRALEGLSGPGGAAMIFQPQGSIHAVSTDYPFIKNLDPSRAFALPRRQLPSEHERRRPIQWLEAVTGPARATT
jgi:hypothetical protein